MGFNFTRIIHSNEINNDKVDEIALRNLLRDQEVCYQLNVTSQEDSAVAFEKLMKITRNKYVNKFIRLNNGISIKLENINKVYWEKIETEFYFREISIIDKFNAEFIFSEEVVTESSSVELYKGPHQTNLVGILKIKTKILQGLNFLKKMRFFQI